MAPKIGVDDILDEYYDQGYKDLVESIDEDLGPNIESQLAEVMKTIWGKSKLSDKHKKLFKKIPSNCKFMTTPLLNPEIYNLIFDNVKAKDKAAQRRQRLTVKASVPILTAMALLKETKAVLAVMAIELGGMLKSKIAIRP